MLNIVSVPLLLLTFTLAADTTGPEYVGNCVTKKIDLKDKTRFFSMNGRPSLINIPNLDPNQYDMTIDYGDTQVKSTSTGLELVITNTNTGPIAPRMSTTRFMRYGKFSAYMSAAAVAGVVTTFIGAGPNLPDSTLDLTGTDPATGDEIDFEFVGYPLH